MPRSLQSRLLLSFFVCVTAILAAGGFVTYKVIEHYVREEHDDLLRDRLEFYESTFNIRNRVDVPVAGSLINPQEWERITAASNPDLVTVYYLPDGKFLMRSRAMNPKPDVSYDLPLIRTGGDTVVYQDYTLWDGRPARLISQEFSPPKADPSITSSPRLQVVVGRDLLRLEDTLSRVRWFLVKIGLAVMGIVLVATRYIVRRGVKPVSNLAQQIEHIPLAEDRERFALPGAPTELQPVVGRLNALMDRVDAAIEHERQFASNAAHELRNPLAAIRSKIEVALSRIRKAEEYEETLESIWQSQQGMQRVVDHLLLLARLESGHGKNEFIAESATLSRMLKKAWRGCLDAAEEKNLRVVWQVEDADTEVLVVVSLFEIVYTNLLQNAVNYTPAGGEVKIKAGIKDGFCCVAVENTNPGLTAEKLDQTFSPFWRADPNASGHRGNAGIGLALCRRIAITLGGRMTASLTPEGMVHYRAEFPADVTGLDGTVPGIKKPPARRTAPAGVS